MSYINRIEQINIEFSLTLEEIESLPTLDLKKILDEDSDFDPEYFLFTLFKIHGWYIHFKQNPIIGHYEFFLGHSLHQIPNIFEFKNSTMYKILDILKRYVSNLDASFLHLGEDRWDIHKVEINHHNITIYEIDQIIWTKL
jgi:hypothetical protein